MTPCNITQPVFLNTTQYGNIYDSVPVLHSCPACKHAVPVLGGYRGRDRPSGSCNRPAPTTRHTTPEALLPRPHPSNMAT